LFLRRPDRQAATGAAAATELRLGELTVKAALDATSSSFDGHEATGGDWSPAEPTRLIEHSHLSVAQYDHEVVRTLSHGSQSPLRRAPLSRITISSFWCSDPPGGLSAEPRSAATLPLTRDTEQRDVERGDGPAVRRSLERDR
jgi:hypothetical protein